MRIDRRDFLKLGGAGIAGVLFTPLINGCEENTVTPGAASGRSPFITPVDRFFVQHGGRDTIRTWTMPNLTKESWSMKIRGEVANELTLTWDDIEVARTDSQEVTFLKTMQCVLEGPLRPGPTGYLGNAYWTGIPLKYFLDKARLDPESTKRLVVTGYDTFYNNLKPERIFRSEELGLIQPMLVYAMNGQPLTVEHGFPVRLMVQEMLGYKNVKWVKDINASLFETVTGTYQLEGFDPEGLMPVYSRSTGLYEELELPHGPYELSGFAVSGAAGIERVEVSFDGGSFSPASFVPFDQIRTEAQLPSNIVQLAEGESYPFRSVWAAWRINWNAFAGRHTIAIRATDSKGNVQLDEDPKIQDGQNGVTRYVINVT